jgi:hypothetical protein
MTTKVLKVQPVKRPPKTTLAVLRRSLPDPEQTIEKWVRVSKDEAIDIKNSRESKGRFFAPKPVTARLSVETVARWLGCSEANVRDIECAKVLRKKTKAGRLRKLVRRLTYNQAEIMANQAAINIGWLLGDNPANPFDWYGRPYTPETFKERQAELARRKQDRKFAAHLVQVNLAKGTAILAATLLRAFQDGKDDVVALRVIDTLRGLYRDVDKTGIDRNGLVGSFLAGRHKTTRPDLKPTLHAWEAHFRKMLPQRLKPKPRPAKPTAKSAKRKPARR